MGTSYQQPLFLDIETVAAAPSYKALDPTLQRLWDKKASYLGASSSQEAAELFAKKAGIFAEFGKVIVIALGYVRATPEGHTSLQVRAIGDDDEAALLREFKQLMRAFPQRGLQLCGHNGKEFDFPYLCRRMSIHGIPLPEVLDTAGKKPWEVNHLDTMELWKFGDRKHYTSLELLAHLMGLPSSKATMKGSQVGHYYYVKRDLEAIKRYCAADVVVTAQLFRRLRFLPLIPEHAVVVSL